MQKEAKTILLFIEHRVAIDYLSDEDAGKLIKALFAYADEGDLPDFNGPMMSLFTVIGSQIDRSREAYKEKCEKNRTNSMKRKVMQGKVKDVSMGNDRQPSLSTDNDRNPPSTTVILPNPNPDPIPNPNPNPDIDDGADTLIINEAEMVEEEEYPFNKIWNLYGKPVGDKEQLRQRWQQLSFDEKKKIFEYVPKYVLARPDNKYRKDFANFLSYRTWESEPLTSNILHNGNFNQYSTPSYGTKRAIALQNTELLVSQFLASGSEPAVSFGEGEG